MRIYLFVHLYVCTKACYLHSSQVVFPSLVCSSLCDSACRHVCVSAESVHLCVCICFHY